MKELSKSEINLVSGGIAFVIPAGLAIAKWVGYTGGVLSLAALAINRIR